MLAHSKDRASLIPILREGQARHGYLPPEFMDGVAKALDLPVSEVFGVASFYSFLSVKPLGRHTIWVCKCLPCHMRGGRDLLEAVQRELGVGLGEITTDGSFSVQMTNCIGACDRAPALMVNADRYGLVTPQGIREILEKYK